MLSKKSLIKRTISIAVFFSLASSCFLGVSAAQDLPVLFHRIEDHARQYAAPYGLVEPAGSIGVNVDFSLIRPSNDAVDRLSAVLPDKLITLMRKATITRGADAYTWLGRVHGYRQGTVVLSVVNGVMYGHIDLDGDAYFIEPQNGEYFVIKHDASRVPLFEDDIRVPPAAAGMDRSVLDYQQQEDGSRIDVLVLYSQQMLDRYGSTGIGALIQHFVDLANEGYSESGVNTRLRLRHSELYRNTGAVEGVLIGNALDHITGDSQIATLRDDVKADLVCLLRRFNSGSSCGVAWVMQNVAHTSANYAFSVVEVRSQSEANPYYCDERTFAHELGHNLGCAHDRNHAVVKGAYDYSYGYDVPGVFGTIMSYDGPTITRFSTPNRTYSGYPIGKNADDPQSAHNVLTINNTRVTVANFKFAALSAGQDISASPTSYDFGSVPVGFPSAVQRFAVTNQGTDDLLMGLAAILGADAPAFAKQNDSCSGQTLAASETCTVEVVFSPLSQGVKRAILAISSNDPDSPTLDVALAGEGVPLSTVDPDEGTIGTKFTLTGLGFGKKAKAYLEYQHPENGEIKQKYAKVLKRTEYSIEVRWKRKLPPGTYDILVLSKDKGALPIDMGTFSIMAPIITGGETLNGAAGATVLITGRFFTNKKPKVYLQNPLTLKRRRCEVQTATMDPATGLSVLEFVVPKWDSGNYHLLLETRIDETATSFTIN